MCCPPDCGNDVDAAFERNDDAVDFSFEAPTALTTTENDEQNNLRDHQADGDLVDEDLIEIDVANLDEKCNLWDYQAVKEVVDEDSIEMDIANLNEINDEFPPCDGDDGDSDKRLGRHSQRRMKVLSRRLPYSDDELLFLDCGQDVIDFGEDGVVVAAGSGSYAMTTRSREFRSLKSLRGRIEAADALVQSRAPSYIEFQAKAWHPELSSHPSLPGLCDNGDNLTSTDDRAPSILRSSAIDYQSQRTFVTIPSRSKPHASSRSAHEFLEALQSAAVEACSSDTAERLTGNESCFDMIGDNNNNRYLNPKPSVVVMEFLGIIRESRVRPQASPFRLMKKVWTLIAQWHPDAKEAGD